MPSKNLNRYRDIINHHKNGFKELCLCCVNKRRKENYFILVREQHDVSHTYLKRKKIKNPKDKKIIGRGSACD